ncbi:MAG TPA: site-specific integrase [Methylomirabilota bacterium]|nr:site-specific integrase [Methylomirabilota bacterium]
MARSSPYLQRRGDTFWFRIAVPQDLRLYFDRREVIHSLKTTSKHEAVPRALALASKVKLSFTQLRQMSDKSKENVLRFMEKYQLRMKNQKLKDEYEEQILNQKIKHNRVLRQKDEQLELLQKQNLALKQTLETIASVGSNGHSALQTPPATIESPLLSEVIDDFMTRYPAAKKEAMYDKLKPCLAALLEILGDKPVSELKQRDLVDFFRVVEKLPPRWAYEARERKIPLRKLAEENAAKQGQGLSEKTFDGTWIASIRTFINDAKTHWLDQGFPSTLTISGIAYRGDRNKTENKQRPLAAAELKRLFEGSAMKSLAGNPALAHQYWLPHIGLYTGARVREICQLNPQTDIMKNDGIWFFQFTEETEAAEGVKKSIKNAPSKRQIPIHSKLIELGFLEYWKAVKDSGEKLIFPRWRPKAGKASARAVEWFSGFLRETGLHDSTAGKKVLGMHVFRHTMEHFGFNLGVPADDVALITGRSREGNRVQQGYQGEAWPKKLQGIIERIHFDIDHIKPVPFTVAEASSARRRGAPSRRRI